MSLPPFIVAAPLKYSYRFAVRLARNLGFVCPWLANMDHRAGFALSHKISKEILVETTKPHASWPRYTTPKDARCDGAMPRPAATHHHGPTARGGWDLPPPNPVCLTTNKKSLYS